MNTDPEGDTLSPGDIIALNEEGTRYFEGRNFDPVTGIIYLNIMARNVRVLRSGKRQVLVELIQEKYPVGPARPNRFSVTRAHLRRAEPEPGT